MKILPTILITSFASLILSLQPSIRNAAALQPEPPAYESGTHFECKEHYQQCLLKVPPNDWTAAFNCTNQYGECLYQNREPQSPVDCEELAKALVNFYTSSCQSTHSSDPNLLHLCFVNTWAGGWYYEEFVCPPEGIGSAG